MRWMLILLVPTLLFSIQIDLADPILEDGVLKTDKGGVIRTDDLRIQAEKFCYSKESVSAEGNLMVEMGRLLFIGRKIEYDFETKTGVIYDGRCGIEPWFFGGRTIYIHPDRSYSFFDAFATTSESALPEWFLSTKRATLKQDLSLQARHLTLNYENVPLLWFPSIKANIRSVIDSPLRFTFRWGGGQGSRIGAIYEAYRDERWQGFARIDYRYERGFGGGFEMYYRGLHTSERLDAINYIAEDWKRRERTESTRYRFLGLYGNAFDSGRTTLWLSYDKLSDKEMATDYNDKGLRLEAAKPTEFYIRRQEVNAIFSSTTRIRINDFQTIKQELPTVGATFRPQVLGKTGILAEGRLEGSYLEFEYQDSDLDTRDYNSPRLEASGKLWRPIHAGCINVTPEAGFVSIWYGNNPHHKERLVNAGCFRTVAEAPFFRFYGNEKHVISPYVDWQCLTLPSTDPTKHFIFDITDGWYKLNNIRVGATQNLYRKDGWGCIRRPLFIDIWGNAFYDTHTIPVFMQKMYSSVVWCPWSRIKETARVAWDFEHNRLDHINLGVQWTVNDNAAIAVEWRKRSPYDWRKVDKENFILDSFRTSRFLRHTSLSDKRDTLLIHLFYRFHPNWAIQFQSRSGWGRRDLEKQPPYFEYEADLLGTIRSAWRFKFSYRHREDEDRFFVNLTLSLQRPDPCPCPPMLQAID